MIKGEVVKGMNREAIGKGYKFSEAGLRLTQA